MFILTQNRTGVVDTSKCLSIRIVEDAKTIRAYGLNSDTWFRLGYYRTTKRALLSNYKEGKGCNSRD